MLAATDVERGLVKTGVGYLHYRAVGSGRPIVMLHVSHRSSAMYVDTMLRLGDEFRCVAFDLPGAGDSDHPQRPLSIPEYADAIAEGIQQLGLKRVFQMGQAIGSYISVDLAVRHSAIIDKLVLQSCPFYLDEQMVKERHAAALAAYETDSTGFPIPRSMQDVYDRDMAHAPLHPTQAWLDQENVDYVKAGRRFWDGMKAVAVYSPQLGSSLERVACPTLLVMGKDFLYTKQVDEFRKRVKNLQVALIPESGLFPQIDNQAEYDRAVRAFLR